MRLLVVQFCIIAVVLGQSRGPSSSQPSWIPKECKNSPKTDIKKCCTILPNLEYESKKCLSNSKTSSKDGMCSSIDCIMNSFGFLKNGTFDAETAKKSIAAMKKDKQWTTDLVAKIVDGCVTTGQAQVKEWKDTAKGPKCSDTTLLNMAIGHCIRREFFFQCPGLVSSGECGAVIDYGKACSLFPMQQSQKKDNKKTEKKSTEN